MGSYSAWLEKIQGGSLKSIIFDAEKLLTAKLENSAKEVSPKGAATEVMLDHLTEIKKDADALVANLSTPSPMTLERANFVSSITTPKTLTDPVNQQEVLNSAKALIDAEPAVQQRIATIVRAKLWEDTATAVLTANPDAGPKEMAEAYNKNLQALADKAGPALAHRLKLDAPSPNPNVKKSMADTFIELANAAEKMDPKTALDKLDAKVKELQKASALIATDISALEAKLDTKNTDNYETDPAKRKGLEVDLAKLKAAQKDLSDPDPKVGKIAALKAQKTKLEKIVGTDPGPQKNNPNPEKNKGLARAVGQANAAVTAIERVVPPINRASTAYLDKLQEIKIDGPDHKAVRDAYQYDEKTGEGNRSTGDVLRTFQTNVEALNKATEKLRELSKKLVTPEAMKVYEARYRNAVQTVDNCCATIGRQLNDDNARDLIETAYKSQGKKDALISITTDLAKLDNASIRLAGALDLPPRPGTRIEPVGEDSIFMRARSAVEHKAAAAAEAIGDFAKDKGYQGLADKADRASKHFEGGDDRRAKANDEALQKYYTFSYKKYKRETGETETIELKDKKGNPVNLSYEEVKGLAAKWNAEHPNQKPITVTKNTFGSGYYIECNKSSIRDEFAKTMCAFQDNKLDKQAAASVKEGALPKDGDGIKEGFVPIAADGVPAAADDAADDDADDADAEPPAAEPPAAERAPGP